VSLQAADPDRASEAAEEVGAHPAYEVGTAIPALGIHVLPPGAADARELRRLAGASGPVVVELDQGGPSADHLALPEEAAPT
jgi:hypothetical protein